MRLGGSLRFTSLFASGEIRLRIAYLVSQYPATTHTFILREVRALRGLGADVLVVSILAPDRPPEWMGPEEHEEAASTFYVKPLGVAGALRYHVAALASNPAAYLRGLLYALRLGGVVGRRAL